MTIFLRKTHHLAAWLLCFLTLPLAGYAQESVTSLSGVVLDSETGEKLPFVQVYFTKPSDGGEVPSTYGTTTDMEGQFKLSNPAGYTTLHFQMLGYKPQTYTLRAGQKQKGVRIKIKPDIYGLKDVVVTPDGQKQKYRRKGNPAVELIRNVIAHKDSQQVKSADYYTAHTYHRMSFALDNFNPDFTKGFWKHVPFVANYIDTVGVYPTLPISIREKLGHEYFQRSPQRQHKETYKHRIVGAEHLFTTETIESNMKAVFTDVDIYEDNMEILFNRFVSPVSSSLAVAYYQYYIMDTLLLEGDSVIDLAFVPVNSESYSFTGHLYILNDSTYKIKKYTINIPQHINLNFVSHYTIEHNFRRLENGLWAPDRTKTFCKFYLVDKKKTLIARQTKIYTDFDFETSVEDHLSPSAPPEEDLMTLREEARYWDEHRPEPLTYAESAVLDLLEELTSTPRFNAVIMTIDAILTEYLPTVPASRWGESKWDFGPIYNTVSWNKLEGVRLRVGGTTTANLHRQFFFSGYLAFGTTDLRPKGNVELLWSFNKKHYHQNEHLRDYIALSAQYDVEEPGLHEGVASRDNIVLSIPIGTITDKYEQYVLRSKLQYYKHFPNNFIINTHFDYEYNEAAGAMHYDRITDVDGKGTVFAPERCYDAFGRNAYHNYETTLELRYMPGAQFPLNRYGVESLINFNKDRTIISLQHQFGFLDDRGMLDSKGVGGKGFLYNYTQLMVEKRFWFSSFGHLDTKLQAGYIWDRVPFTKLYRPPTSSSILLGVNCFNQMKPSEFLFDAYVSLYATYYFKGWIFNRIPGINRLQLRGVVSFAAIYGCLTDKNNPTIAGNEGLYAIPDEVAGRSSTPISPTMPYMEFTAGIENIFKVLRIDYVRRLTYNEYMLPNGQMQKIGAWGRNGVKITVRFAL